MEEQCLTIDDNPRKGKNMFALGLLAIDLQSRPRDRIDEQIAYAFRKKSEEVYRAERRAAAARVRLGRARDLDFRIDVPSAPSHRAARRDERQRSARHGRARSGHGALRDVSDHAGDLGVALSGRGVRAVRRHLHQAEDEIAAAGVAIGASYAGKVALTITSGPGLALKTEFIGLAVMTEIPLVVVDVQRGGPSTGLPTKVEQSDLLAVLFAQPGDAPRIVLAPATIEECFHVMITARRIAEAFRTVVIVLSDANLATGVSRSRGRQLEERWHAPAAGSVAVPPGTTPYDWDPRDRAVAPAHSRASPAACTRVTGLAHDEAQQGRLRRRRPPAQLDAMRSRKLAVLQQMLLPPAVHGDDDGRSAGRRMGKHQGRDRGSGRPATRRGTSRVVAFI